MSLLLFSLCISLKSQGVSLYGRSIQFDPVFDYYRGRSADSVASEIEVNGYKVVRYIVTNDLDVDDRLIQAFHHRGMRVWYQTFGNGFYGKPRGLPPGWEKWQMKLLHSDEHSYTFLSVSNPEYRRWKTAQISRVMSAHDFDGAEVAEPFQMGWNGPEKGSYGDFSDAALSAFTRDSGYVSPPDFSNPASPLFYKKDRVRYQKWVQFRVDEVCQFVRQLQVGTKPARRGRPFSIWTLANSSPDPNRTGQQLIREWQGVDAVEIARIAQPDLICFETNWPDWMTPELPGTYPSGYSSFTLPLRRAFPKIPFIFQADLGSSPNSRRSRAWIHQFEIASLKMGATGSTLYMHGIEKWIYTEPPEVRSVEPIRGGLRLIFQKRLEPKSSVSLDNYSFSPYVKILSASVDGNIVNLKLDRYNFSTSHRLKIRGVHDDPRQWIFKGSPAHPCQETILVAPFLTGGQEPKQFSLRSLSNSSDRP